MRSAYAHRVFREAKRQGAFIFWNHPHWIAQQADGVAKLTEMHQLLINEGLLNGIEVVNEKTYSEEALQLALDHNLTLMSNSDIHGLVDWDYGIPDGGHRPVTLVFAKEKTKEALREGLENQRSAVWFNNTLVGNSEFLTPLIQHSLKVSRTGRPMAPTVLIDNQSDADYILENLTAYTFHNHADIITVKAHEITSIQVKIREELARFDLQFRVLNAVEAPGSHPEITFEIENN